MSHLLQLYDPNEDMMLINRFTIVQVHKDIDTKLAFLLIARPDAEDECVYTSMTVEEVQRAVDEAERVERQQEREKDWE